MLKESNSFKTTSYSRKEIDSCKPVVLTETGQELEVSTITMTRLSSFGSMKKISSESFPCNLVVILEPSSIDWLEPRNK